MKEINSRNVTAWPHSINVIAPAREAVRLDLKSRARKKKNTPASQAVSMMRIFVARKMDTPGIR
ncbi:MAG: hypothetical protein OEZ32_06265 [Nitrospinota bacterium]|nr:hypothetical protein [Nitrospinota bacterium]